MYSALNALADVNVSHPVGANLATSTTIQGEWRVWKAGNGERDVRNVGQCLENPSVRLKETTV
jgi:hypothetical protein